MTIQEAIDRLLAWHAPLDASMTVDGVKIGDTSLELTGIVTTICASIDVIRKAIDLGANLIICHEPVFYSTLDNDTSWLEESGNKVYQEKKKLCEEHGITIFRDHDHMHNDGKVEGHVDGIYSGVIRELGWDDYLEGGYSRPMFIRLPVQTTVRELALHFKNKIGMNGVRVIGNPDAQVWNICMYSHIEAFKTDYEVTNLLNRDDVDVLVPLEVIDWSVCNYARDAEQLGYNKAVINIGHFNGEELGMKYAAGWIGCVVGAPVDVTFVRSADIAHYII